MIDRLFVAVHQLGKGGLVARPGQFDELLFLHGDTSFRGIGNCFAGVDVRIDPF